MEITPPLNSSLDSGSTLACRTTSSDSQSSDHNNNNTNQPNNNNNPSTPTTLVSADHTAAVDQEESSSSLNQDNNNNTDSSELQGGGGGEEEDQNNNNNSPPGVDSEINKTEEEEEKQEEKEDSSDIESNISKLSEEIDRFRTLLSSTAPVDDQNPPPEIPISIENFIKFVEADLLNQETSKEPEKWLQDSNEGPSLLQSIHRISKLTQSLGDFHFDPNYAASGNRTGTVLQKAMAFLEEEFRTLLEDSRSCDAEPIVINPKSKKQEKQGSFNNDHDRCTLPEPGSSGDVKFPGYAPEVVSNLNRIATAMISAGYETECCQVYSITRRNVFDDSLNKLGFEKISIDDVQKMQWESLESEIATWIKTFKRCITVYFAGERKLCEAVFSDFPPVSASLFSNLTRSVVIQLLNFAEAVAMTKRSAEKLFKFLDMYETLRDLTPAMDEIFFDESSAELKAEISSARCRLGEAVVSIFCDLENSIKSDTGRTPVPGGAVHPLTRYTMNYLKYACEYKDTLEQVFQEHKKIDNNSDAESDTPNHNSQAAQAPSPFAMQLMNVMDLLDANLDTKAKLYKDLSLSYIFLMNNGRYIMQKIKGSVEIYHLMGDNWSRKRSSDLRNYHKNYQRETWGKVLQCLRDEGLQVNGKVSKPVLKERFKSFNSMFDEIHKTQSTWVVSDEQLQSELRVSISAVMIPAYRSFLARFRQYLDSGRQAEKYIKYGPDDIETSIDELFDGNPASMVRRRT